MARDGCPECGSVKVRWRNRTKRDVLQQWLSYVFDSTLGRLLVGSRPGETHGGRRTSNLPNHNSLHHPVQVSDAIYDNSRDEREFAIGRVTPRRFWRWPDCRKRGHLYDDELIEKVQRDIGR